MHAELSGGQFVPFLQPKPDTIPTGEFLAGTRIESISVTDLSEYSNVLLAGIIAMPYALPQEREDQIGKRTTEYFQEALLHPEEWSLLAAKDESGKIMGALEAKIVETGGARVGYVHWICVGPESRQKGVGVDLYRDYEQRMMNLGDVSYIMAYVDNANMPSLSLHRKLGIEQVFSEREDGRGKWYYKPLK